MITQNKMLTMIVTTLLALSPVKAEEVKAEQLVSTRVAVGLCISGAACWGALYYYNNYYWVDRTSLETLQANLEIAYQQGVCALEITGKTRLKSTNCDTAARICNLLKFYRKAIQRKKKDIRTQLSTVYSNEYIDTMIISLEDYTKGLV